MNYLIPVFGYFIVYLLRWSMQYPSYVLVLLHRQGIIMDEQLNIKKEKRSALRRLVIRKALKSTLMPHSSLSNEIAFAKSVILPENDRKTAMRGNKEKCKVIRKRVGEMQCSSFDEKIKIAASTINPDEQTRDLNAKGKHKRRVRTLS